MKRLGLMLGAVCFLLSGVIMADISDATIRPVKHHVNKHKAHKATKHKTPKRHHNSV
jgi:hypothetical protein